MIHPISYLRFLLVLFFFVFSYLAKAQILNIEKLRLETDTAKALKAKGVVGFNAYNRSAAVDEPVNQVGLNASANVLYQPHQHGYIFIGQSEYLRVNNEDVLSFGYAHFRVNFLRERKINYEVFTQYSYDRFRGLTARKLAGGAIRTKIFSTDNSEMQISIGALYESERWRDPNTEEIVEINIPKSSNYIRFQTTISKTVDLNTLVYYQTGYDQVAKVFRHRMSGNININTKLSKNLSFQNSFEMAYEDKPIIPITKLVFALKIGLSINI